MQVFEEVYQTLAKILVKKAQFAIDSSDWNSEEKEMFRVYRQDVCDCLTYCFELRGFSMLNELVDWAESQLSAAEIVLNIFIYALFANFKCFKINIIESRGACNSVARN
jgi:hypothetical protein